MKVSSPQSGVYNAHKYKILDGAGEADRLLPVTATVTDGACRRPMLAHAGRRWKAECALRSLAIRQ
jgi:hypothetical protein